MRLGVSLQISSFLQVVPPWLPPVTIATGYILLLIGMGSQYFDGKMNEWPSYNPVIGRMSVILLSGSVAIAAYVTIQNRGLTLLFAFLIFMSGRFLQGAISLRLFQKIIEFLRPDNDKKPQKEYNNSTYGIISGLFRLIKSIRPKIRNHIFAFFAANIITIHTTLSIASVYFFGDGSNIEAIKRFWIGFFLLTTVGIAFDFRHFAYRLSWLAAFGMVISISGAFLYSPVGFSSSTVALAPYLDNSIPDWMRFPLGTAGFVFGVIFWTIIYSKNN